MAANDESPAVAAANATGRWQWRIALVSAAVAIVTSLVTLLSVSAQLRGASGKLEKSIKTAENVVESAKPIVPVGTITASLLNPQKFESLVGSVQDSAAQAVWVLADGRDVRGSAYAKLSGEASVPDLRGYALQDTRTHSGTLKNGESLIATLDQGSVRRPWHWSVSLREANPVTPFDEWEQRMQKLMVSADDPARVLATATIYNGKLRRFAPDTPASVNYLGVSVIGQNVYWYVKVNDG